MENILMGGIVGFALLTLGSYFFIVIQKPFLIIPAAFLLLISILKHLIREIKGVKIKANFRTFLIILVFLFGIAGQMAVISPSGRFDKNTDLVFWSAHGHDGAWHIALMEEIKKGYPFQNPVFAGEKLVNYHFFSDILPAMVSKYWPGSGPLLDLNLYFRVFPFIYSLFLGASAYYLTKKITGSFTASIWATVFTYFAGSFGFAATYIKSRTIGGESIFWATQPQSSSGNPPQIISNFLVLASLYFLIKLLKEKGKFNFAVCFILLGTLSAFKIYAGVVLLAAVGIAGIWQFLKNKNFQLLLLTFFSGILAASLYFPNASGGTSFLIFQPWWYIRTMIVEPSRLNLVDWELRRQTYLYEQNWKRVIFLEGVGFLIFFFGNLGMRFIGIWDFLKTSKDSLKNHFGLIFILTAILSLLLPLLFLQRGVASNTSQFLQYFVLLFGILAGISAGRLIDTLKFPIYRLMATLLFVVLMIPTQAGLIYEFYGSPKYPRPAFSKISQAELQALKFIKDNTDKSDVILTPPYNQYLDLKDKTPNIWDWFDTAYVSAFSSRRTYMDDYEQVDIMGYDYKNRFETKKTVFESNDPDRIKDLLLKTGADFVYFPKSIRPKENLKNAGFSIFFQNQEVEVWRIN